MNKSDIVTITTGFLNSVNDTYPGGGTDAPGLRPGQLGAEITVNAAQATALTASGNTLYEGRYKYVQFKLTQSGTTLKQGPVYWDDPDNFIVTADVPAGFLGYAGNALNVVTKGNYGWIQIEGKALCQPLDNTTIASPAIGDTMVCATIGRYDDVTDPCASNLLFGAIAGQWITAPVDATLTPYLAYIRFATKVASAF